MSEQWLTTLITDTPQAGFELAITLSRRGVKTTQPDVEVLKKLRNVYANDADSLTAASQVIAINFQTIAAANNYWRS
ncbi:hexameric tyrosine-coordinated heme protein [Kingella sp. (in: b-proteobacteria)]|uniref:hexameric tyrosine-coordinated heme protein n=1 Tax=Kingella sp. (in: b-proteobacteria) TaxID=2020713 RepID=UPI0026DC2F4A|nr:hexameric tyrosine-coordinated heme protein [Kingella sp. (in: b-proteobacteria)]MDO4658456.1 hexameric tyrosine-coordinated heme protein [Kingella sp. (in: b-proteobacteria)]